MGPTVLENNNDEPENDINIEQSNLDVDIEEKENRSFTNIDEVISELMENEELWE